MSSVEEMRFLSEVFAEARAKDKLITVSTLGAGDVVGNVVKVTSGGVVVDSFYSGAAYYVPFFAVGMVFDSVVSSR